MKTLKLKRYLNDHNTCYQPPFVSHRRARARATPISLLESNFADRTQFLLILYAMIGFAVTICLHI